MDNILHAFIGLIGAGSFVFLGAYVHLLLQKRSLAKFGNVILDGKILEEREQ